MYVALPAISGKKLVIGASSYSDNDKYYYIKSTASFQSGKYYSISVKMKDGTVVFNESELNSAISDNAPYIVLGSDIPLSNCVQVNGDKNIVLDLCGQTLSRSLADVDTNGHVIEVFSGNTLTVHAADVVGSATYRCRARYNSGSVYSYDTITIIDKTDNYQADIDSTAGDIFKNTVGQTCLICRLWQNGKEVDPLKSTTYSTTAPSSPATGDFYYQIQSSGAATKLMRYSGSKWEDVTSNATYKHTKTYKWYRRDKDGNPMDSGAVFATGKVIYVDGDDVDTKTVFVCEVE